MGRGSFFIYFFDDKKGVSFFRIGVEHKLGYFELKEKINPNQLSFIR